MYLKTLTSFIKNSLIITLFILPINALADIRGLPQITVLASSSVTFPLTEVARIYSRKENITVTTSFESSSEQARRIIQGESADVFICSDPAIMANVKQEGVIDVYSITNLWGNKLALIISKKSHFGQDIISGTGILEKIDYLQDRTIMVIGEQSTPLGQYTKQFLESLDKNNNTKILDKLNLKTIKSANSKNNLFLIAKGETAGITYYSDAYNNPEVNILSIIDDKLHDPIIYQGAVVAGENMSYARGFLDFLQSDISKAIFKKYGFIVN